MATMPVALRRDQRLAEQGDRRTLSMTRLLAPLGGLLLLALIVRLYQQAFAFDHGLDSTAPEYARYWYPWLAFNTVGIGSIMLAWWVWLARTRCTTCTEQVEATGAVDKQHELGHIWRLLGIVVGLSAFFFLAILMAEQDAGWHQTSLRDTSFTPIHIFLFYMTFPVILGLTIGTFLYGRTRLPGTWGKARGIPMSFVMLITGFVLNFLNVSFNEWGHGVWIFEELFANPMHWGFVGFSLIGASLFSVLLEALDRVIEIHGGGAGSGLEEASAAA